jgi:hypothetical protein
VDDTNLLNYIHNSLGLGVIYIKNKRSTFIVRNLNDVAVIIDIFSRNTLNTTSPGGTPLGPPSGSPRGKTFKLS